jgi:transcriptional regulator with XRE-family HTH domain/tetratricopeptide (TPR) repeat protein
VDRDRLTFAALLRRYRMRAGVTQQALAERARLSLRGLSDLERGVRRVPYADTLDRLVDALELGPADRAILQAAGRREGGARPSERVLERPVAQSESADTGSHPWRKSAPQRGLPFVGRQGELATLAGFLETARRGYGRFVFLSGEPGIGKTRLTLELAERAESQGWRVLYGSATALEGAPAYLPISEALSGYVDACPAETLRLQLGQAAPDVALLLPGIRSRLPEVPPSNTSGLDSGRYQLLASVCDFLSAIARASKHGLLLVLEDLHWADASTLLLLRFLVSKLAGSSLLVLGTHRSAEVELTPALADLLADVSRAGTGEHLALAPLSPAEVSALLADLHGAPVPTEVVDTLHAETEGNPFFLASLVQQLVSTGCDLSNANALATPRVVPLDVRWIIRQRLSRLSPTANAMLRVAAVLGDWFGFDVLAEMSGASPDSTIITLEEAQAADVIRPEGGGYRFSHALIRDTLYDGISLPRRQRLHHDAARAMERVKSNSIEGQVAAIATHLRLAGSMADRGAVIEYSLRAGEAARTVYAWEDVATHWEAALELMETQGTDVEVRARHLERVAEVMLILGWEFYPRQIAYLERALEAYRQTDASEQMISLHIELAAAYARINLSTINLPRSMSHFQAAEALLSAHPDAKLGSRLYRNLADAYVWSARTAEALAASRQAMIMDASLAPEERLGAPVTTGWHLAFAGRLAEGLAALEQAWETDARRSGIESFFSSAFRSDLALYLGDPRDGYAWRQRELANSRLAPGRRRAVLSGMAVACAEAGDLGEAAHLQAEASWQGLDHLQSLYPVPLLAFRRGDWARSRAMWTEAVERHRRTGTRLSEADFACWLARVHRVEGDINAAEATLGVALAIGAEATSQMIEMWTRPELAIICAQDGRHADAEQHVNRCRVILAAGEDWRGLAGRVALAEAVLASSLANWEVAEREFHQAVSIYQRWTLPWSKAEALSAWGSTLATAGRWPLAVQKFDAARAIYYRHGAGEPWLRYVDALQNVKAPPSRSSP